MKTLRLLVAVVFAGAVLLAGTSQVIADESDVACTIAANSSGSFSFGTPVPVDHHLYYSNSACVDLTLGLRDCCIRDDVVEVRIDASSLLWTVDSRNGDYGTHPWQYKTFDLCPGNHDIKLTNTVSPPGASGWYWSMDEAFPLVAIDIKPLSFPNSINRRNKKGVIPVAILGSATFDVTTVDVTSLVFEGASPTHDLTSAITYADHLYDANLDGFIDLVSHYWAQDTGLAFGDTTGTLTFMAAGCCPYSRTDSVRIVH